MGIPEGLLQRRELPGRRRGPRSCAPRQPSRATASQGTPSMIRPSSSRCRRRSRRSRSRSSARARRSTPAAPRRAASAWIHSAARRAVHVSRSGEPRRSPSAALPARRHRSARGRRRRNRRAVGGWREHVAPRLGQARAARSAAARERSMPWARAPPLSRSSTSTCSGMAPTPPRARHAAGSVPRDRARPRPPQRRDRPAALPELELLVVVRARARRQLEGARGSRRSERAAHAPWNNERPGHGARRAASERSPAWPPATSTRRRVRLRARALGRAAKRPLAAIALRP